MKRYDDIYAGGIQGTDQLDPADSLAGEIGEDPLDVGYSPPERESVATRWGNTLEEVRQGESLAAHLAEEEPEFCDRDLDEIDEDPQAGRLVVPDGGAYGDVGRADIAEIAPDVGRRGWAVSAGEGAMHVVDGQ